MHYLQWPELYWELMLHLLQVTQCKCWVLGAMSGCGGGAAVTSGIEQRLNVIVQPSSLSDSDPPTVTSNLPYMWAEALVRYYLACLSAILKDGPGPLILRKQTHIRIGSFNSRNQSVESDLNPHVVGRVTEWKYLQRNTIPVSICLRCIVSLPGGQNIAKEIQQMCKRQIRTKNLSKYISQDIA